MINSAKKNNLKRRVWVEIDVSRLRANYAKIAAAVKPLKVLCVLKANAYGLGVMPYAAALAETDCAGFGVAEPFEALQLAGGPKPVQILSSVLPDEIEPMVAAGVTLPVVWAKRVRPSCICFTVYDENAFMPRRTFLCAKACSAARATWASWAGSAQCIPAPSADSSTRVKAMAGS